MYRIDRNAVLRSRPQLPGETARSHASVDEQRSASGRAEKIGAWQVRSALLIAAIFAGLSCVGCASVLHDTDECVGPAGFCQPFFGS
jgi:hypothetical protein